MLKKSLIFSKEDIRNIFDLYRQLSELKRIEGYHACMKLMGFMIVFYCLFCSSNFMKMKHMHIIKKSSELAAELLSEESKNTVLGGVNIETEKHKNMVKSVCFD